MNLLCFCFYVIFCQIAERSTSSKLAQMYRLLLPNLNGQSKSDKQQCCAKCWTAEQTEKLGVLCQEHCVEVFSRETDHSQWVSRTLHYSQSSPDYLEEKLLQATDEPVGTGWGHWIRGGMWHQTQPADFWQCTTGGFWRKKKKGPGKRHWGDGE